MASPISDNDDGTLDTPYVDIPRTVDECEELEEDQHEKEVVCSPSVKRRRKLAMEAAGSKGSEGTLKAAADSC